MKCPRCQHDMINCLIFDYADYVVYNCFTDNCPVIQLEESIYSDNFMYTLNLPGKYNHITIQTGSNGFEDFTTISSIDADMNLHVICNLTELLITMSEDRLKTILAWS